MRLVPSWLDISPRVGWSKRSRPEVEVSEEILPDGKRVRHAENPGGALEKRNTCFTGAMLAFLKVFERRV